jgi:class 3 adenylate cyclase
MMPKTLPLTDGDLVVDRPAPVPPLAPGELLDGRYRISRLIAEGGMGAIYEAEAVRIGRPVAVKVLHPRFAASPMEVERFRREARTAVQVSSPHVVEMLDFGQAATGELFLVMELLRGESLRDRLARQGALPPSQVADLMRQLLRGLAAAHAAGIVHRDLKPDNLWLVPEEGHERLTILDFGIAKQAGGVPGAATTQAGLVVGTPEYLSPEQAVGGELDHRADLYSAGLIAWVLLTGRHPFPYADTRALLKAQAYDPVPSPEREAPELAAHPALLRFVARATVKDRTGRAQSAGELLAILDGREGGRSTPRHEMPHPEPPRRRGPRPVSSFFWPVTAGLRRARTLTLLATEIDGWGERAAALPPEERARLLLAHDRLVIPALHAFEGRRALVAEEALTADFGSPTNAVLCAMAIQDRVAAWNATAPEADRLALRLSLHAGELTGGRVAPQALPVALLEATRQRTPAGAIWLTRAVALTMNQTEVPLEPVADAVALPGGEPLALYRVRPSEGPLPYGGREAERVPRDTGVSRLLEPVTDTIGSLEEGGERRWRAGVRVAWALLSLVALAAAWLLSLVATALVALLGRIAGWGREARWATRGRGGVSAARGWLSRRWTVSRASLARPLRARPRPATPVEDAVEPEITEAQESEAQESEGPVGVGPVGEGPAPAAGPDAGRGAG